MLESANDFIHVQRRFLFTDIPPVIGHRGAALHAPENTLAGIREAKTQGARWVEVDVKLSADGIPYLLHDENLERTTSGIGPSNTKSIVDLAILDAGSWFGKPYVGETIPTLAELLKLLVALDMSVNIEIKPNLEEDEATTASVISMLEKYWPMSRPKPLLSSYSHRALAFARDRAPAIPRGLLLERPNGETLQQMDDLACASLHVNADHIQFEWIAEFSQQQIPILCYTVNDADRAISLLNAGVHSIITDTPKTLIKALLVNQ